MFQTLWQFRGLRFNLSQKRKFSVKAVYSTFPASLNYYGSQQKLSLFDRNEGGQRLGDVYDEGVDVANNGLVYPGVDHQEFVSNGAVMFPNTFTRQEHIRMYFDNYLDHEDSGKLVDIPIIFTIPKGTPIPSHLILFNEHMARFSLQPSYGMSLQELNESLNKFFSKHAAIDTAENWIDSHPYETSIEDDADAVWMEN